MSQHCFYVRPLIQDSMNVFNSQGRGQMGAIRKGVGKLVAACEIPPLVVPFVHSGMEDVMPRGKVLPSTGKEVCVVVMPLALSITCNLASCFSQVRVLIGQPIPMNDLMAAARHQGWSEDRLHTAVAARVSRCLRTLKAQLDSGCESSASPMSLDDDLHSGVVSSLDHYDESDLKWEHRASMWEKAKFKMQHRAGRLGLPFLASNHHLDEPLASSSSSSSSSPAPFPRQILPSSTSCVRETGSILSLIKQIRIAPLFSANLFHSNGRWRPLDVSWGLQGCGGGSTSQLEIFDRHRTEELMRMLSL